MIGTTLSVIETLLAADGISAGVIRTVREVIAADGMVPTGRVCKTLGLSTWTVRRLCEKHGVRRVSRPGRQGALVHLPSLQAAMAPAGGRCARAFSQAAPASGIPAEKSKCALSACASLLEVGTSVACQTEIGMNGNVVKGDDGNEK